MRRDGTVLAGGWLPDFVRLGELELPAAKVFTDWRDKAGPAPPGAVRRAGVLL